MRNNIRLYSNTKSVTLYGTNNVERSVFNPVYKVWRDAVMSRDLCICQDCGKRAAHAHHVESWKDSPELRYDPANGIALCKSCHEDLHGFKFNHAKPIVDSVSPIVSTVTLPRRRNVLTVVPLTLTTRKDGTLCLT